MRKFTLKNPNYNLFWDISIQFDTTDSSNDAKTLAFTLDPLNTDIFTYKNVVEELKDTITGEQNSITILVKDLPASSITLIFKEISLEITLQS